jgi:hypothetical protein
VGTSPVTHRFLLRETRCSHPGDDALDHEREPFVPNSECPHFARTYFRIPSVLGGGA